MTVDKENIKKLLNPKATQDEQLDAIYSLTEARLQALIDEEKVAQQLEYIVLEVTLKRFRRIGNEGMQSYSEGGESITFTDSDFGEYQAEIERYLEDQDKGKSRHARVWML